MPTKPLFARVALIGIGLIGSSLARRMRRDGLAGQIVCCAKSERSRRTALALGIVDAAFERPEEAVAEANLVVLCTPLGAYAAVAKAIAPALAPGAILTDVGSVKGPAIAQIGRHVPAGVHFVPGHPVAGTRRSGRLPALSRDRFLGAAEWSPEHDSELRAMVTYLKDSENPDPQERSPLPVGGNKLPKDNGPRATDNGRPQVQL